MTDRAEGWYWCKNRKGQWGVYFYKGSKSTGMWRTTDSIRNHYDRDFLEIGPRIPTPDEPWVTVPEHATDDMIEQGFIDSGYCQGKATEEHAWDMMLSASPRP